MKIRSSFIHFHVVTNLYDFLLWTTKAEVLKKALDALFVEFTTNGDFSVQA